MLRRLVCFVALACLCSGSRADRVVTHDGRVLHPKKAREEGQGYRLVFEAGEILLPSKELLKAVEIEGDMSDYVPKNDDEREKLEQGYVRYRGRWLSKAAYQNELDKEHEESRKRTQEAAEHADFSNAWELETKHFLVKSNTSPELLDYYGELLEAYFTLMDKRFKIKLSPSMRRLKMEVRIYKNRDEFQRISGVPPGVAGFFSPAEKNLNFYHDYEEPGISDWVCLHEGTHLLTFLIDPQYIPQIWINEAVADYFGSATIERDKRGRIEITPGKLQTDRVLTVQQAIAKSNDIKLEDLFFISRESFGAFEYAHAWSFVYFLNNTRKYQKGFDKFFTDLYTLKKGIEYEIVNYADISGTGKRVSPAEIRRVLLKALKVDDTDLLESEWKEFIGAVPIEGPEARLKRGYQAVAYGRIFEGDLDANRKAALEDLDAAIEAGCEDARAYWARHRVLLLSGDRRAAMKDLEKAIELDPLKASFRFGMGELMSRGEGVEKAPDAAPYLGLAVELAPDNENYRRRYEEFMSR